MAENVKEDVIPENIQPLKWKLVKLVGTVDRYCNPPQWDFKILKMSSFRPAWMGNMFSKYWNTPPMGGEDQKANGKVEEVKEIPQNGEQRIESYPTVPSDRTDSKRSDGTAELVREEKSPDNLEAARRDSEVLTEDEVQALGKAPEGQIRILWIGHSSLLIQMEGRNIVTDPIFSSKAGPKNMIGYKRYRRPAVTVEQLKGIKDFKIDAVVISHNHYDHFDKESVKVLNHHFRGIKWFVPMKMGSDLTSLGCENVQEADWWQSCSLEPDGRKPTFCFTPAKHWSGRNPTDWYVSLWGSWIIKGETATVFFAGDTGYQREIFEAIRKKFSPIAIAALPIGAYEPREKMKCQHVNPDEAVRIHKDLGAKMSIGIHWRTFQLSCEEIDQPIHDLEKAKKKHGLNKEDFITLEKSLMTTIPVDHVEECDQSLNQPDLPIDYVNECHQCVYQPDLPIDYVNECHQSLYQPD